MQAEDEQQTAEGAVEDYKATLSELTSNSKVEIVALTMLAEDLKEYAVKIATCIEAQLNTVSNRRKLPVLYLIDSICKNYPNSRYVELFTQNIVSNFYKVFEVSDEKVRRSLYKLRVSWDAAKIFPQKKLNAIDERVHELDPNWPILHKITSASSQQRPQPPQQQSQQQQRQQQSQQIRNNPPSSNAQDITGTKRANNNNNSNNNNNNNNSQSNGRRKRQKLGANRNNQPSEQPVLVPLPQAFIDPSIIQTPHDLPQVHPTTYMDPSITMAPNDQLHQVPTGPYLDPNTMLIASTEPQLSSASQLLCTPYNQTTQSQPTPQELPQPAHMSVLESLYGGKQCSNCSLRFDDNNRYAIHLDWHYRQNLKSDNMFARRKWYYPLNLWVQFREINDDDLQDNNNPDTNANDLLLPVNDHEVPTAPASKDDEKNICSVCHETFEKFWAEEEEEWRLKNAKLYEDERVYHPLCLMDMLQASAADLNISA